MEFERNLQVRIALGYIVVLIVGISMVFIMVHERRRIREIETETEELRQVRHEINTAYQDITTLALLGEGVIGWDEADYRHYHAQRLRTDSLLQALKSQCTAYVHTARIDTLRSLLADKEDHLRHLTEILARQDEADSLLVNHLPEVARRAHLKKSPANSS